MHDLLSLYDGRAGWLWVCDQARKYSHQHTSRPRLVDAVTRLHRTLRECKLLNRTCFTEACKVKFWGRAGAALPRAEGEGRGWGGVGGGALHKSALSHYMMRYISDDSDDSLLRAGLWHLRTAHEHRGKLR